MTPLEWLMAFLLSLEGSLRANAISEKRLRKLQAEANEKARLLATITNLQSLRDQLKALSTNVARFKAEVGLAPDEESLFQLLTDETFQDDLVNWLSAGSPPEEQRLQSVILDRMAKTLESSGATPNQIQRLKQQYIERIEKELFSNPVLVAWRLNLRVANLQSQLASEGVAIRTVVREESETIREAIAKIALGYEADIEQLRTRTRLVLESLSRTSAIHIHEDEVKIPRLSVNAIGAAACDGHVVVVGDPGAGKSVGIYDLAASLHNGGTDVVVINVQRTTADSLGALQVEFGLTHDLIDVLEHWSGPGYGYLIIDALDAARSAEAAATFNDLIEGVRELN